MPRAKFLLKLFSKSLRFPKAAPWSLVATSETFLWDFLFAKLFILVGAGARPVGDEASAINGKNKER